MSLEWVAINVKSPFCISVNLSDTFKIRMKQGKQLFCDYLQESKSWRPNQLFLLWCIWSWLIWVSVKIMKSLFWFLQNSSPRSCSKGSLKSSILYVRHAVNIKEKKESLIQFYIFFSVRLNKHIQFLQFKNTCKKKIWKNRCNTGKIKCI